MKSRLHIVEQIKVFNALVELAEANPTRVKKLSIPELRKEILNKIQK
jgi:hypothetical protein